MSARASVPPPLCGVFPLPTVMLRLVDELLMLGPLSRRELPVDLGSHPRLDRVELRPHPCPKGIGLGTVPRNDGAHRIPLRPAEVQLPTQKRDQRVGSAVRTAVLTVCRFDA